MTEANANAGSIKIHLIQWDEDILRRAAEYGSELNGSEKAHSGRAVSQLTGVFASMLFYDGGKPERLISHYDSGKPYMDGHEGITVSISHCGSTAAVSVSHVCHGIDIEKPRAVRRNISRHVFTDEENAIYDALQSDSEREDYFFTCWTRKEALIKTGVMTLGGMTGVSADKAHILYKGYDYWWKTIKHGELYISLCCRGVPLRIETAEEDRNAQLAAEWLHREFYNARKG